MSPVSDGVPYLVGPIFSRQISKEDFQELRKTLLEELLPRIFACGYQAP